MEIRDFIYSGYLYSKQPKYKGSPTEIVGYSYIKRKVSKKMHKTKVIEITASEFQEAYGQLNKTQHGNPEN